MDRVRRMRKATNSCIEITIGEEMRLKEERLLEALGQKKK